MLESILYFTLGFFSAALLALMVLPAIWSRAATLTRRRIEATVPLTLNEIQADKDQLRAEFAMSTRRLEMSIEELREKAGRQLAEIGRKRDELTRLAEESRQKIAAIAELETRGTDLREQLRRREEELTTLRAELDTTRGTLEGSAHDLERLNSRFTQVRAEADTRGVELAAKAAALDRLEGRMSQSETEVRGLRATIAGLEGDVERLRGEKADLAAQAAAMRRQLDDTEAERAAQVREVALLREADGERNAAEGRIEDELLREKSRSVELEAELAQSRLKMEALLNDASNDNVVRAMASLNRDRASHGEELKTILAERDRLRDDLLSRERSAADEWADERRDNAIMRERLNDLAAKVASMTAALEGRNSPIDELIGSAPANPLAELAVLDHPDDGAQLTLADRIRALRQGAQKG